MTPIPPFTTDQMFDGDALLKEMAQPPALKPESYRLHAFLAPVLSSKVDELLASRNQEELYKVEQIKQNQILTVYNAATAFFFGLHHLDMLRAMHGKITQMKKEAKVATSVEAAQAIINSVAGLGPTLVGYPLDPQVAMQVYDNVQSFNKLLTPVRSLGNIDYTVFAEAADSNHLRTFPEIVKYLENPTAGLVLDGKNGFKYNSVDAQSNPQLARLALKTMGSFVNVHMSAVVDHEYKHLLPIRFNEAPFCLQPIHMSIGSKTPSEKILHVDKIQFATKHMYDRFGHEKLKGVNGHAECALFYCP